MYNLTLNNKKNIFFYTFALFLLSHFFNIYYFGIEFGGDWWAYSTVAKNILSGCGVSISEIGSGECIPHFGGNQGPGYPLFIAICWYLFNNSNLSVIIIQNFILFLSYVYIILTINNYIKSKKILIFLIFTLNFSPMYFAWSRHLLTETLSISLTIIIFSILIKSFFKKKIDIYKLVTTFICLTFIRLDGILLLIPIIFSFFAIYKFKNVKLLIRKILIFLIIFSIPWGIWGFRNYMVNLPIFMPSIYTLPGNNNTPTGFIKWVSTWSTSQYEVSSTLFPVYKKLYSEISIPNNILEKINEKNKINILLKELKLFDGQNFPNDIDTQFLEIANNKIKNELQNYYLIIPLKRIFFLWLNPYNSFGWPLELNLSHKERINFFNQELITKIKIGLNYKYQIFGKIFINFWKLFILFFFIILFLKIKERDIEIRNIFYFTLIFIVVKSLVMSYMNMNFSRYLVTLFPLMEISIIIFFAPRFLNKN